MPTTSDDLAEPVPRRYPQRRGHESAEPPAWRATSEFGRWIQNADVKAGLLTAVAGSVIAGVVSQRGAAAPTETPAVPVLSLVLLAAVLLALALGFAELALSQASRLTPSAATYLSFPWVADRDLDELARCADEEDPSAAWEHVRLLARIARAKHRHLRRAVWCVTAAAALFLAWLAATGLS